VVVSWRDEAGRHHESFTVQLPQAYPTCLRMG
jgi:hypothetical protein